MEIIENLGNSVAGELLLVFIVSMVPIAELRVAIPMGIAFGISPWICILVAVLGDLVPVPFIILFIRRIFQWLRGKSAKFEKLVSSLERRAQSKAGMIYKYELLGLVLLVAIPLPGTGTWTGSLVAAVLDIRLKNAFPAIAAGAVIAGILVTALSVGVSALF